MNYIFRLILNGIPFLFADDMKLIITGKTYGKVVEKANSDLNLITRNKLVVNLQKSNYMVMCCPNKDLNLSISCGNVSLNCIYKTKILGITLDPDLRFSTYAEELCSKIK